MYYRLKDKFKRWKFTKAVKGILDTPPMHSRTDRPIVVLTQLQHKDVLMFIVAAKSFIHFIPVKCVIVLNDGSLSQTDEILLKKHFSMINIYHIREFSSDLRCPIGGTWERLLGITEFTKDNFVVQLDSDTITLKHPTEVQTNIDRKRSFTIGTWDNQEIEAMCVCSERVKNREDVNNFSHVQMIAEANFTKLKNCSDLYYIRGCSGFAGFAKGTIDNNFIYNFSSSMYEIIGDKWNDWGSEQIMSNVIIANTFDARVLPHPDYSDCTKMTQNNVFIHFIGDCRFDKGIYGRLSRKISDRLKANSDGKSLLS